MNHNLAPSFESTTQTHIPRLDGARDAPVPPRLCEFFSEHAHTQTEEHGVDLGNRSPRSENEHHHARGHPQSIHPSV